MQIVIVKNSHPNTDFEKTTVFLDDGCKVLLLNVNGEVSHKRVDRVYWEIKFTGCP